MMPAARHKAIAVFGSSTIERNGEAWRDAEACGRLLAEVPLAVATGGYGGVMEAVSAGAAAAGGHVIGVTAPQVFPTRSGPNAHVTEVVEAGSITERIHLLVSLTAGAIVLPGSLGTFTELTAAWNAAYVAPFAEQRAKPIVTVGGPWNDLVDGLSAALGANRGDIHSVDSASQAVALVQQLLGLG